MLHPEAEPIPGFERLQVHFFHSLVPHVQAAQLPETRSEDSSGAQGCGWVICPKALLLPPLLSFYLFLFSSFLVILSPALPLSPPLISFSPFPFLFSFSTLSLSFLGTQWRELAFNCPITSQASTLSRSGPRGQHPAQMPRAE